MNAQSDFQPFFDRFIGSLALDQTRVSRIESALRHLAELVENDAQMRRYRPRLMRQGSYATGLAIRPARTTDEYDVDVVLEVNLGWAVTPTTALDWLESRIREDGVFRSRLVSHPRCVRIDYASDFHLDVVPGRRRRTASGVFQGRIDAPDRTRGWHPSCPSGFTLWCAKQNRRTGGDFARMVWLLKRWRDIQASDRRRIRSIVFTTLVGRCVPSWAPTGDSTRPDADVLFQTLVRLNRYLASRERVPRVPNPSLPGENLARTWSQTSFERFRGEVREALEDSGFARAASHPQAWRAVFGSEFPTEA